MADTFDGVIAFAFLAMMLLAGTVLRARLPFLQSALVPASLIGGVLGFTLLATGLALGHESGDFAAFTFHFFTLSFMSLCLTGRESSGEAEGSVVPGGSWLSMIWTASLVLQGLVGILVVAAWNGLSGDSLSPFLGAIATHGFTQGPGQAMAMGGIWESEFAINNAVSFGLIYASAGFIVAFIVGVPLARWFIARGMTTSPDARMDEEFVVGILRRESEMSAGRQITHPANVDSLAFHLGILGVAYLLTHHWLEFMGPIAAGVDLGGIHIGVFFSHNLFFFHGLIVCTLMRMAMDRTGLGHYIDNETQRRITGSAVDLMVTATIMSIQFSLLVAFLTPILLVCLSITLVTALLCFGMGRQLTRLGPERALAVFGCCCGSTGSGLLLLRMLDPGMRTPVAKELAFFNIAILVVTLHILAIVAPVLPNFSWQMIGAIYGATLVAALAGAWALARAMARS